MNVNDMLRQLQEERGRIDQAISALQGLDSAGSTSTPRRGRPAANATSPGTRRGRRRMSAAARKRISEAAKARWAARKGTTRAKSASGIKSASTSAKRARRGMTAAGRKRISEMMKARWAARKRAK